MERSSISLSVTIATYYTAQTVFAFVNNSMTLYDVSPLEVYRAKPMPTYYSEAYSHRRYFRLTGSSLYIFPFVNVLVTYCVLTSDVAFPEKYVTENFQEIFR